MKIYPWDRSKGNEVSLFSNLGLGNDLFLLAAGLFVASKSKANILLDLSRIDPKSRQLYTGLKAIKVYVNEKEVAITETQQTLNRIQMQILRARVKFLRKLNHSKLKSRYFKSEVVGYDSTLKNVIAPVSLMGYFQSFIYVQELEKLNGELSIQISEPTQWYVKKIAEIISEPATLGIHIRRGDYLEDRHRNTQGALSLQYYLEASHEIVTRYNLKKIYIFTDDISWVKQNLHLFPQVEREVIDPPKSSDPAESLILLSKCKFLSISNSTFSWWSAYLSRNNSKVWAPSPWYFGLAEPDQLLPYEWQKRASIWETN